MTDKRWKLLESVTRELHEQGTINPKFFGVLANRLRTALDSRNHDDVSALDSQIGQLLTKAYSLPAPKVAKTLPTAKSLVHPIESAYILGQLDFAHQLAASTVGSRIPEETLSKAAEQRFRPYLQALFDEPLNGTELAAACNQRPETVSRNIGELRELGLVEYRRQGTAFVNFLTPLGRTVSQNVGIRPKQKPPIIQHSCELEKMRSEISPSMRSFPILGVTRRVAA